MPLSDLALQIPSLGWWEILLIILIAIILFGPQKIPQLARSLGEAIREFRKAEKGLFEKEEEKKEKIEEYRDLIIDLAKKLDVKTEGRELSDILKDVLAKAKEKGVFEEATKKLERLK